MRSDSASKLLDILVNAFKATEDGGVFDVAAYEKALIDAGFSASRIQDSIIVQHVHDSIEVTEEAFRKMIDECEKDSCPLTPICPGDTSWK